MIWLVLSISLFSSCQTENLSEPHVEFENLSEQELRIMNWSKYQVFVGSERLNLHDYVIRTTGMVKSKCTDSVLFLLPHDTIPFEVMFTPKAEGISGFRRHFQAATNPHFNEDWMELPSGSLPTPLTANQQIAFGNYSHFRMLNQAIPEFELEYARGGLCTRNDFLGKTTVLNFWSASCLPCVAEIPALNSLVAAFEGNENVQFLSFYADSIEVNAQEELIYKRPGMVGTAKNIRGKAMDFHFTQIANAADVFKDFDVRSIPVNMVVDKHGIIRCIVKGASVDRNNQMLIDELESVINDLLQVDSSM